MVYDVTARCKFLLTQAAASGRLGQNLRDILDSSSTHIKLGHVIQTQTGQAAVQGIQVAAAAVDVDDPISVPDGIILVPPAGKKYRGCVTDDTDRIRVWICAVWFHATPNAGITIISGKTVDKMKVLVVHCEIQIVWQAGEKLQDAVSFLGRAVVEQLARRKTLCKRFSTKSRMALENRADSGLDPLITESHGGQNGMCAGTA